MKNIIDRAIESLDTNIYVKGVSPSEVDAFLERVGWELGEVSTGYCCDDWSYAEYINDECPGVKLTMEWNGWTGQVELVATTIEEDE